jgi:hypothetical protein
MDAEIREAIDPGPLVNPGARAAVLDRRAKAVVGRLITAMDRAARAAVDREHDHLGGAVDWYTGKLVADDRVELAA